MRELDQLVGAVDAVVATATSEKAQHEIAETLRVVSCQMNRLQAVIAEHTLAMERTGAHKATGHGSPAEFLKRECHYSGAQARSVLRSGTVLAESLPRTAEALKAGTITWPHATSLVRGVAALGPEEVSANEDKWINKVAVQSGPERLQRVLRARVHEKVPQAQSPVDQEGDAAKGISLRKLAKRGYEVHGFLPLDDGAVIEQAVSKLRSLENAPKDSDPIVAIADWWLRNPSGLQGQPGSDSRDHGLVELFGSAQTSVTAPTPFPTVRPSCDFDADPLASSSAKSLAIAKRDDDVTQTPRTDDRCRQPGCSAVPHWCDYHGTMDRLAYKLLTAA
ncbi:DUF222 domain-containing protein [Kutzneria kofuensis]|uniref:DUF222 domain-containing protein n=1 Tax=Kutzneria kofuensis TaxID=103725 RepID=A0A7W9KFE0_9PSEU|nr:DUF222 domain-containing protein [Kutzneria kofuensis]MBB5891536.1 hypothetical protein [Kutzneria kofuensis]